MNRLEETPVYDAQWPQPPVTEADLAGNPYLQAVLEHGHLRDDETFWGWPPLAFGDQKQAFEALRRFSNRDYLQHYYAWAIPGSLALTELAGLGPLLELGAGGGYWASLLRDQGADIVAVDPDPPPASGRDKGWSFKPWTDVIKGDGVTYAANEQERALLLCWPSPYSENTCWAADALRAYQGDMVAFIGESNDCTGSKVFHQLLKEEFAVQKHVAIPSFHTIHDRLTIHKRR